MRSFGPLLNTSAIRGENMKHSDHKKGTSPTTGVGRPVYTTVVVGHSTPHHGEIYKTTWVSIKLTYAHSSEHKWKEEWFSSCYVHAHQIASNRIRLWFRIKLMIYIVWTVYNVTKQFNKLIFEPSIIIIKELSWTRSEIIVIISFLEIKCLLQYYFSKYLCFLVSVFLLV